MLIDRVLQLERSQVIGEAICLAAGDPSRARIVYFEMRSIKVGKGKEMEKGLTVAKIKGKG